MSLRIKICGITNPEDALAAAELGADALGFMFYEPSPRHVTLDTAAHIIRELPPFVTPVGVFVNPAAEFVHEAVRRTGITTLQLHGDDPPEFCPQFSAKMIKAFRVQDRASLDVLVRYDTDAWLLDGFVPGKYGGGGATFNWDLAVMAKKHGTPILLAGGLTPENIAAAVATVQPFGVDVSGGVESAPGRKDRAKIRAFIEAALAAAQTGNVSSPGVPRTPAD